MSAESFTRYTMASVPQCDIAVITIGNSGVGKSYIDNVLLGENKFVHEINPDSVTTEVEFAQVSHLLNGRQTKMLIFNIPGLIESDPDKIPRNKRAIEAAFAAHKHQVIMYVFGNEGGRIRAEDVSAFKAVSAAFALNPKSVLFVFNKKPKGAKPDYEPKTVALATRLLGWDGAMRYVFLEDVSVSGGNPSVDNPAAREALLYGIATSMPTDHVKKHDIVTPDGKALEEMQKLITNLTAQLAQESQRNREERDRIEREHKQHLAEQEAIRQRDRAEHQQQLQRLQREGQERETRLQQQVEQAIAEQRRQEQARKQAEAEGRAEAARQAKALQDQMAAQQREFEVKLKREKESNRAQVQTQEKRFKFGDVVPGVGHIIDAIGSLFG